MPERRAHATWEGGLKDGNGSMKLGSGAYEGAYSFRSRFEDGEGTNPEEMIGAAHAGCFSMALAMALEEEGYEPESINTDASVSLKQGEDGVKISHVHIETTAAVPDITEEAFQDIAHAAKEDCPVSKALSVPIRFDASLEG